MRNSGRQYNEIRKVSIETGILLNAEGSCLIKLGNTHVICSASVEEKVPFFLRGKQEGWLTAEYNMIPKCSSQRVPREVSRGKPSGRTQEIQRLIGRSLRSILDLKLLGERQIIIDCDVLNADGGTRTASITGGYVALSMAINRLMEKGILFQSPIKSQIAAISCGVYKGNVIVDLEYIEDSQAEVDANFVFTSHGKIVEVQSAAEKEPFTKTQLMEMFDMAKHTMSELFQYQLQAIDGKI